MPAGFAAPGILFLNTWDSPERAFSRKVFGACRDKGYTRYVELCSGAFAMPLVAHAAGWKPADMECSDVSLYSAITGTLLDGQDFAALDIRVDGEPVEIPDVPPVRQAAHLLYVQLLARMQARPDVHYWRALVRDLLERGEEHRAVIADRLGLLGSRLGGLRYRPMDLWDHLAEVIDDPHTLVNVNPPTYAGGFERFFDTKSRLTWNVPDYQVFDPITGVNRLVADTDGAACLLLCLEQRAPGNPTHPRPVFGRHLSLGQNVYLFSNRPEEIFGITGGPLVMPSKAQDLSPLDLPVLPYDHPVTADSTVQIVAVKSQVADYYRDLWMHRLRATPGPGNALVVVDGNAAGVIGFNPVSVTRALMHNKGYDDRVLLRFAFGAPHETLRMTRLATMLAVQKRTAELAVGQTSQNAMYVAASVGVMTVEYSPHPEAKGLRGLMKQTARIPDGDGYRLIYLADWQHEPDPQKVLAAFLAKEQTWQKSRSVSR